MGYTQVIKRHPTYLHIWADDQGNVYSSLVTGHKIDKGFPQKKLKPYPDKDGYLRIDVEGKNRQLNRVIFACFNPTVCIDGLEIDHIDRVKTNDRPDNLRAVTHYENMQNRN